ncbi:ankyrin repeat domain-containing protein [Campylobacter mucosalis]|uniref:ankyrin repeat domain-containing protein n=1 Tax=Campylobacter mucosalis TaxID=202 RepID=UPI00147074F2|nr:ankyrin repeat domain-containing protein [Campylobacter mucosalis]
MRKILVIGAVFALLFAGCGAKNRTIRNAIKDNNTTVLDERITPENINRYVAKGMTPLMFAIRNGANLDTIKDLVNKGADVNQANRKLHDPIYYSVIYNRLDVLKYLVLVGATSKISLQHLKDIAGKKGYLDVQTYLETLKF